MPRGIYLRGCLKCVNVQPKAISVKTGIHQSTLSKFLNGIKDVNDDQLIAIVFAAGQAEAEARLRGTRREAV